jgi:hypothetical protein
MKLPKMGKMRVENASDNEMPKKQTRNAKKDKGKKNITMSLWPKNHWWWNQSDLHQVPHGIAQNGKKWELRMPQIMKSKEANKKCKER